MTVTFSAVMERFRLSLFLSLTCFHLCDTFILPLKTTNGSLIVDHLVGHMTLLEQTITGFQQTIKTQDADIAALKAEIANLKASQQVVAGHSTDITTLKNEISNLNANQQVLSSHGTDIAALKTEIANLKTNQHKLETRISDLQKQVQPGLTSAEVTSLKSQVNATKTEMTLVSNEVISLTSQFSNLTQDYQSLSSQVKADQNLTKTVHAVQDTLSRVVSHVHSAKNDRFLLHDLVNNLNKTITDLSNNSNVTTTALLSEIAHIKREVRFDILLGPTYVNLPASSWTTLKFRAVDYNKSGGYNATTGVFTAPVSGTYLFWTQVRKISGSQLYLHLWKGNHLTGGFYTSTAGVVTGTVITAAAVTAGEQVYVAVKGASVVYCCQYSRFGGALLYRH